MKQIIGMFILLSLLPSLSRATQTVELGNMKVTYFSNHRFKVALVVAADNTRLSIDCLDGRLPTNSLMYLIGPSIGTVSHEIFDGTSDFYCQGLATRLGRGLKVGDIVRVQVDVDLTIGTKSDEMYESATVTDVKFLVPGEADFRSMRSNLGTNVSFSSLEFLSTKR